MSEADRRVRRILDHLEGRIDLAHVAAARARQRAALDFAELDRLPITFYLPYEGREIAAYPYPEAFADPAKMMVNELLVGFTSLYHAVDLRDDAPYCLRPNFGTGLIAAMFGAEVRLVEDNPPWVLPLAPARLQAVADGPLPDPGAGLGRRVWEQYAYFRTTVEDYPVCKAALQFTLPDLQGPFSTAELLWGSLIYVDLYDRPELVHAVLDKVTRQMVAVYRALLGEVKDDLGDGYCSQHATGVAGRILVRNDSMVNLSAKMYREHVLPYDRQLGQELGCLGMHFCGNGQHQAANLLAIPATRSIDLGNPEKLDLDRLYTLGASRRVALLRLSAPGPQLSATRLRARFPCGATLVHSVAGLAEAQARLRQYVET